VPRDLPVSDGRLLVTFDRDCVIRDVRFCSHAADSTPGGTLALAAPT
jgi:hypothetical protein